jgi:imidazolonepropionase-like amidohydrolase
MSTAGEASTVILVDLLIDGTGRDPVADAAIVLDGARVRTAGPRAQLGPTPRSAELIDLRGTGRVLMPGLVDAHSHLWHFFLGDVQIRQFDPPAYIVARAVRNAARRLGEGVTTTREMGTPDNLDIGLRDAIADGVVPGPRIFASGLGLAVTGGMYGKQAPFRRQTLEITGADEARRAVRRQIDAGVDFIKLFATAGVGERGHAQMTFEEIAAATEEGHKAGKTVAAHAIATDGIKTCIRAGVDTIEHGKALDDEVVAMMRDAGVALVPTLAVGRTIAERAVELGRGADVAENARMVLELHQRSVRLAHDGGVKIAAGTDPAYADTMARECALLVDTCLSPMEAIVGATRLGAEILRQAHDFGTVEVGKRADVIIVARNPLEDIRALAEVEYVYQAGVPVKRPHAAAPQPAR